MRKRGKALSVLAAVAMLGGVAAAGAANATTEPPGTEPAGTEAVGTEPMGTDSMGTDSMGTDSMGTDSMGTDAMGSEPMGSDAAGGDEGGPSAGAGSGSDSGIEGADLAGTEVTVFGVEDGDVERGAMQTALDQFAEENDMTITYTGSRGFEGEVGTMVQGGSPPDIGMFPQPGRIAAYAASGDAFQLPDDVVASVSENWGGSWMFNTNVDGAQYGVPIKADLKSLVWYLPSVFEENGYEVPATLDDFFALTEQMIADGNTPLCVGIESDDATGWPFTDWVEELILREQGIDFYNQWVAHEVPFNSPEVIDAMQQVADLWNTEDMVYADGGTIVDTSFQDNAVPLVDGDCMMHRQANFFAAFFPEGTEFGTEEGQVSTFYFPSNEGTPTLVGGINAAAFRDAPEVWAVMQYLGSPEFADARQAAQAEAAAGGITGFLTANLGADPAGFTDLEQGFLEILQTADPAGFDASDQMPSAASTAFLANATSLVNGDVSAEEAANAVEEAWPAE
jgi:alpha-glucoside transport system substrate-binding protein